MLRYFYYTGNLTKIHFFSLSVPCKFIVEVGKSKSDQFTHRIKGLVGPKMVVATVFTPY